MIRIISYHRFCLFESAGEVYLLFLFGSSSLYVSLWTIISRIEPRLKKIIFDIFASRMQISLCLCAV